jgi:ketosteroid isomerase-like protein
MNFNHWRGFVWTGVLLLASGFAAAQEAAVTPQSVEDQADDHAAVWAAVEAIWRATESGNDNWVETMLSADFMGWPNNSPAPRSKSSVRMWNNFDQQQATGITHELYPLSIVVHGDMAVVHYLYTNAVQTRDKKTDVSSGRYTDVLVRDDGSWKFISWHGGEDK